jgi:hypothetical protein
MTPKRRTTQEKLVELLEKQGFHVEFLTPVSGFWKKQDVYRWEGVVTAPDRHGRYSIGCWDTMTRCVRYGIKVDYDHPTYEVSAVR